MNTGVLANKLANLAADLADAQRPIDKRLAKARFDGACEATHAVGFGMNPTAVYLAAWEWIRDNPRPAGGAFPTKRREWHVAATTELSDRLTQLF